MTRSISVITLSGVILALTPQQAAEMSKKFP
jgi:hypothetical protein